MTPAAFTGRREVHRPVRTQAAARTPAAFAGPGGERTCLAGSALVRGPVVRAVERDTG
jgi:hypothetical protein